MVYVVITLLGVLAGIFGALYGKKFAQRVQLEHTLLTASNKERERANEILAQADRILEQNKTLAKQREYQRNEVSHADPNLVRTIELLNSTGAAISRDSDTGVE